MDAYSIRVHFSGLHYVTRTCQLRNRGNVTLRRIGELKAGVLLKDLDNAVHEASSDRCEMTVMGDVEEAETDALIPHHDDVKKSGDRQALPRSEISKPKAIEQGVLEELIRHKNQDRDAYAGPNYHFLATLPLQTRTAGILPASSGQILLPAAPSSNAAS